VVLSAAHALMELERREPCFFDVIITEVDLPVITGIDLMARLQSHNEDHAQAHAHAGDEEHGAEMLMVAVRNGSSQSMQALADAAAKAGLHSFRLFDEFDQIRCGGSSRTEGLTHSHSVCTPSDSVPHTKAVHRERRTLLFPVVRGALLTLDGVVSPSLPQLRGLRQRSQRGRGHDAATTGASGGGGGATSASASAPAALPASCRGPPGTRARAGVDITAQAAG
jgi:CheY-like chemotaxis protein